MNRKLNIFFFLILFSSAVSAQQESEVEGTYVLAMEDDMTLAEAKHKAIENAKAEAIKKKFGTVVANNVLIHSNDVNGVATSNYSENTSEMAKGDWLGDTEPAKIDASWSDGKLLITATVKGIAREIVQAKTEIEWNTLNKPNAESAANTYNNGDNIYVGFRSPVSGYVAVYLLDTEGKAFCLLPYSAASNGKYSVRENKQYIFFDSDSEPESSKRYRMTTKMSVENNDVILIFSPNPFNKTYDRKETNRLPSSVDAFEFQKWLLKCQQEDRNMIVSRKSIKIINNK